jgi:hypothetical protein
MQPIRLIYMNRKLAITITLLTFLCVGLTTQAFAQTRIAGVTSQDNFVYSITSNWQSDNASEPVPAWIADYNTTSQYKVQIGLVSGTNITSTQLWDFKNGTEIPFLITIDIESGTPYYLSGKAPPFEGIVGANINAGSLLHPAGNDSVTVNQTITRTYVAGTRDTNVVDLSSPIQNQTIDPVTNATVLVTIGNQDVTYYIDKATGMLVEQKTVIASTTPKETATITWTLKETNLWDAASSTNTTLFIEIAAIVVVVIVVVAAVLFLTKKGRRSRNKR